jgi:hypothetical protein
MSPFLYQYLHCLAGRKYPQWVSFTGVWEMMWLQDHSENYNTVFGKDVSNISEYTSGPYAQWPDSYRTYQMKDNKKSYDHMTLLWVLTLTEGHKLIDSPLNICGSDWTHSLQPTYLCDRPNSYSVLLHCHCGHNSITLKMMAAHSSETFLQLTVQCRIKMQNTISWSTYTMKAQKPMVRL